MKPYEKLDAWRVAHELVLAVYRATNSFPVRERYGLCSQIRRAVVSIPTNMAEGAAKRGTREFRRYLNIALGSLSELAYLLRLSGDLGLLDQEALKSLNTLLDRAGLLTWLLYDSMADKSVTD